MLLLNLFYMSRMMPPRQHKIFIGPSMLIRGRIILEKVSVKKLSMILSCRISFKEIYPKTDYGINRFNTF